MRPLYLLLALVSCTAGAPSKDDTDTDTPAPDDTDVPDDTGDSDDTAAPDTDVAETDAPDTDTGDTATCAPFPLSEVMSVCDGVPTVVSYLADPSDESCPTWWAADGVTGATVDDVLDALSCERECVYQLHQAVMVLYCRSRGEFMTWTPGATGQVGPGDTCPSWIEAHTVVGSGWFESWEAYQEAFPCPNGDTGDTADTAVETDSDATPDSDTDLAP